MQPKHHRKNETIHSPPHHIKDEEHVPVNRSRVAQPAQHHQKGEVGVALVIARPNPVSQANAEEGEELEQLRPREAEKNPPHVVVERAGNVMEAFDCVVPGAIFLHSRLPASVQGRVYGRRSQHHAHLEDHFIVPCPRCRLLRPP